MNSSGPMYSSPDPASLTALELKRAFVWADTCTGSSEPMRVSLTASFTATALGIMEIIGAVSGTSTGCVVEKVGRVWVQRVWAQNKRRLFVSGSLVIAST